MSSKKQRNSAVQGKEIPAAVRHGVSLIESHLAQHGSMAITVPPHSYRVADTIATAGHQFEVGSVGSARPVLQQERFRQFVAFAAVFASHNTVQSHRFERKTETFRPVTVELHPHDVDGYLMYIPAGTARYTNAKGTAEPHGFTTGVSLLHPGDAAVSFVVASPSLRPADRTMATATEIMQNRTIVGGFTLENGKHYNHSQHVLAYQESIANSAGNMLGCIALGWTYQRYDDFLTNVYDRSPLHNVHLKHALGIGSTELVVPHLMFDAETYSQVADGETPMGAPTLIPRRPLGT